MNASLLADVQTGLISLALTAPRAAVCLAMLPGFAAGTLAGVMRHGVAFAIALPALLPTFTAIQQRPPGFLLSGMLVCKEAAFGALLAVMLSIPMWVAQSIGSILDAQRSPIQLSSTSQDASAVGALLLQAVVLVMVEAGLFIALSRILIESYAIWPAFSLHPPFEPGHLDLLLKRFAEFLWHVVVYGGPVIIPLLLVDFSFAVIGVFASNLQVSFASSPIKSLLGLFILLLYWPIFSHYVAGDFAHMLDFVALFLQYGKA